MQEVIGQSRQVSTFFCIEETEFVPQSDNASTLWLDAANPEVTLFDSQSTPGHERNGS